jgi:hypothetical protein
VVCRAIREAVGHHKHEVTTEVAALDAQGVSYTIEVVIDTMAVRAVEDVRVEAEMAVEPEWMMPPIPTALTFRLQSGTQ